MNITEEEPAQILIHLELAPFGNPLKGDDNDIPKNSPNVKKTYTYKIISV